MPCDIEVENTTAIGANDEQAVQKAKHRWHRKESPSQRRLRDDCLTTQGNPKFRESEDLEFRRSLLQVTGLPVTPNRFATALSTAVSVPAFRALATGEPSLGVERVQ
jgi:hypothetical protein